MVYTYKNDSALGKLKEVDALGNKLARTPAFLLGMEYIQYLRRSLTIKI